MNYAEMCEFVKSLGWKYAGMWANRDFYTLGKYQLVEHNGCWFISKGEDMYFIEGVDENIIAEFTAIVTRIMSNLENPDCTLREYHESLNHLNEFYKKYEDWWPDEDDEEFIALDEEDLNL